MSQGIQFIDIIFLGLVAGFLVLRLRSVLGRRTGNEKQRDSYGLNREAQEARAEQRRGNVVDLPGRKPVDIAPAGPMSPVEAGINQIQLADPSFEPDGFLAGARKAFEMIVAAFAKGDTDFLRPLLGDDVFANFEAAIRERQAQGRVLETEIASFKTIDIEDAGMRDRTAFVTVRFVTEQMVLTRDSEGRVLEGDPTTYDTVTDLWTFCRDTASRDPNWQLVTTATPEEE